MKTSCRTMKLMSLLTLAASTLFADAAFTLVRRDANTVAVVLDNSEPVAGLQLTIVAGSSLSIGAVSGSVSSDWMFASNLRTANELRVVVIGKTRSEFAAGSTEIARLTISASETASSEYALTLTQVVASTNDGASIAASGSSLAWNGVFDVTSPVGFTLAGNYPNPFNPSTTIRYNLDRPAEVTLAVYDMLGREVTVLVSGTQSAGAHQATWTVERGSTATGTYFARLVVGGRSQVARMIVAQ